MMTITIQMFSSLNNFSSKEAFRNIPFQINEGVHKIYHYLRLKFWNYQ